MNDNAARIATWVGLALGVLNLVLIVSTVGSSSYQKIIRNAWLDPLTGSVHPEIEKEAHDFMRPAASDPARQWTATTLARATYVDLGRRRPGPGDSLELQNIVWPKLQEIAKQHLRSEAGFNAGS